MSTNKPRFGESSCNSHPSTPAAQASPDARPARAGEPGAESGAPPSNTAPANCNLPTEGYFRLLRLGVDSLYLSFHGTLRPHVQSVLLSLKEDAQSAIPEQQAQAQYVVGQHIFEVKDKGARMFPYVLEDNAFRIQLANPGKKLPMAYVKVSAEYLAFKSPQDVQDELQTLLSEFGELSGAALVSRIDLAADFVSYTAMDSWPRIAWITRAKEIHNYSKDQVFTGWAIGMGGIIAARLYNKVQEILDSGKSWNVELWRKVGWELHEPVWRLEFELKREFLKEKNLRTLHEVMEHLNGLWSYATTEWLRLTEPNEDDDTRSRWPIHPLWVNLASVDWESTHSERLERASLTREPNEHRLASLAFGAIVSYMASQQIDDHNEAVSALLGLAWDDYTKIARARGLEFEELLAQRVRLKQREYNTAANSPSLVAERLRRAHDAGPDAYRRASRGE